MTDYTNLGLDDQMRPINSPATNNGSAQVNNMDFNSNNERDTIQATNIKNFSFSSGYGGTLTLGGTANGNGQMVVQDSNGSTRISLDNTGLSINNGSVSIKDSSGSIVVDSLGLVSLSAFPNSFAAGNVIGQVVAVGTTDVTNGSLSVVIPRASNVLFLYNLTVYLTETSGTNTGNAYIGLYDGTTELNAGARAQLFSGNRDGITIGNHHLYQNMSAGTHTMKLKSTLNSTAGTPTMTIYAVNFTFIQLGK